MTAVSSVSPSPLAPHSLFTFTQLANGPANPSSTAAGFAMSTEPPSNQAPSAVQALPRQPAFTKRARAAIPFLTAFPIPLSDFIGCLFRGIPNEPMPRSEEHTSELQSLRHLVCR